MKEWICKNLISNNKPISKRCNEEWFIRNNCKEKYDEIVSLTSFLTAPRFAQRLWHIVNDIDYIVKCVNPGCNNPTTFFAFTTGYFKTCCCRCAQKNPETIQKIQQTNLKNYGCLYSQMSKEIRKKSEKTLMEKYGVINISQLDKIKEIKRHTCLKNYGVDSIFRHRKIMEDSIMNKYGVKNVAFIPEILKKRSETKTKIFYNGLFGNPRFRNMVTPDFNIEDYNGTGWDKRYPFKCNRCNNIFDYALRWDRVPRCPNCFKNNHISIFEKEVLNYIQSLIPNDIILENNREILGGKELDIYIPSKKLAIECDGLYWHSEKNGHKDINYHIDKTTKCEKLGIDIIHIFENEWRNDDDIVKLIFKNIIIGNNDNKIYNINLISIDELHSFLFQYSLIKEESCDIILGVFDDNKLVAILTIGNNITEFKINKFITNHNVNENVVLNKLIEYFNKEYNKSKLPIYWDIDRRWYYLYKNLVINWKLCRIIPPQCFYFIETRNHNEFELLEEDIFESDNTLNKSEWDKIWDCGYFRFDLTPSI